MKRGAIGAVSASAMPRPSTFGDLCQPLEIILDVAAIAQRLQRGEKRGERDLQPVELVEDRPVRRVRGVRDRVAQASLDHRRRNAPARIQVVAPEACEFLEPPPRQRGLRTGGFAADRVAVWAGKCEPAIDRVLFGAFEVLHHGRRKRIGTNPIGGKAFRPTIER